MRKTFKKEELETLGLPYDCDRGKVVSDTIVGRSRWSIIHKIVFQLHGQRPEAAWSTTYQHGSTEQQDEAPWQYDTEIVCTLVHEVEKTVKVWEPVEG